MTPSKGLLRCDSVSPKSSCPFTTPLKKDEAKHQNMASYNNTDGMSCFPNHITPPSGLTKFIARNPFDADLTSRLHLSVISPTIFTKVSTPSPDSPGFKWTIDELAMMSPAKIDEFQIQHPHCSDPEIETHAQKAIDKFFSESQIHPSPWDLKKKPMKPLAMLTPTRPSDALVMSRESKQTTRDCWSQTVLTLPPELPKEVEDALKPYFTFNQDQNVEPDDANSSNNSLRRKLFFNHDDESSDDDDKESLNLSPLKCQFSPPSKGACIHGTPVSRIHGMMQRDHESLNYGNVSPPEMSPISNMSCHSFKSRCGSAARLDFTTRMSIDVSTCEENNDFETDVFEQQSVIIKKNEQPDEQNETVEMVSLLQETTPLKRTVKKNYVIERLKDAVDCYQNISNENETSHQNITVVGCSERSSAFQLHDTGYQTCSINNTTDNRSITPVKKPFFWDEQFSGVANNAEIKLSDWQENIKNVFSSTPSKYTRQREN